MNNYIRECGHTEEKAPWGKEPDSYLSGLCAVCKRARIGQRIQFIRFGQPPTVSRNHRDGTDEPGISVYEIISGKARLVGWSFDFIKRAAYRGEGIITGWGSDGEPVVSIVSIKKISEKAKSALLAK